MSTSGVSKACGSKKAARWGLFLVVTAGVVAKLMRSALADLLVVPLLGQERSGHSCLCLNVF